LVGATSKIRDGEGDAASGLVLSFGRSGHGALALTFIIYYSNSRICTALIGTGADGHQLIKPTVIILKIPSSWFAVSALPSLRNYLSGGEKGEERKCA